MDFLALLQWIRDYFQKQKMREDVVSHAYETDAKKEAHYRRELKYVINRADVILEVSIQIIT